MPRIPVGLGSRSYDIIAEIGLLDRAGETLRPLLRGNVAHVVTDDNVARHVMPRFEAGLAAAGVVCEPIILPPGEGTKGWATLTRLCDTLIERGVERSDSVIALGGGVVGDLTGFACAIIKRGCRFVQVPTTLLAQVDSSVGGKTGINTEAGKNLVGAFHQPAAVLIDPLTLRSLPRRELAAGYAEVVKYGLLGDAAFFDWCEEHGEALLAGDLARQLEAIERSVRAKAAIVEADERETEDRRALLNLGHTFGHALEAETGFSERLLHGEAVAAGMALAFGYSARLGLCPDTAPDRVRRHLRHAGLPDGLRAADIGASGETLVAHMLHDKKRSGGTLPFILARDIGQAYVDRSVSLPDVAAYLDKAD